MISFPGNFDWGVASSAYQIEGGHDADGKGSGIWDIFCREPGRIAGGGRGDVGCDHYNHWKEDVGLIAGLGVRSYRLSVSWPRVFPVGKGAVNQAGLDFYDRLIDALLEAEVEPIVNLHHYDLPLALYEAGGWPQPDTGKAYVEYADRMFRLLGDRVSRWITANDVRGTLLGGYVTGERAPGNRGELNMAIQGWHNMNLACAGAVERWHELGGNKGEIGGVMGVLPVYPADESERSLFLAERQWLFYNDAFLSPILTGWYPQELLEILERSGLLPEIGSGDSAALERGKGDFIGISYYTPMRTAPNPEADPANPLTFVKREVRGPRTESGWEIYPPGMYDIIMDIHRKYSPKIYVAETGGAFPDGRFDGGRVIDDDRITYLVEHFRQVRRAMDDGANVQGIHVWTLFDNFEWQQGFTKRFGLIRVDHDTGERIPKKSAEWYRTVIERGAVEWDEGAQR